MSSNNPPTKGDHYRVTRHTDGYVQSNVVVQQVTSEEGNKSNMLTLKRHDDKWTRIVNVSYNANDTPTEKHVTYNKFPWDLDRVAKEYENGGRISFKHMETDRYEQHLTYFGSYQIGQSITVNMKTARTIEPYIAGAHMKEEMEHDFHVPMVEGTIIAGFSPTQTTNEHLKRIMEQEITRIVEDHQLSTRTMSTATDEEEKGNCTYCNSMPCIWVSNKKGMLQFDELEHATLIGDDIPLANQRRKGIYRQMALIMNEGPTGKGVRLELPICIVNGVREMFPEKDHKYMGHMDN